MGNTFECKITKRPLEDGFLNVPAEYLEFFPSAKSSTQIQVYLDSASEAVKKNFMVSSKRITGLAKWYSHNGAQEGDAVSIEALDRGEYRMKLIHTRVTLDKGGLLGKQWFESFRRHLTTMWQKPHWGAVSEAGWTKVMIQLLLDLGERNGYNVKKESGRRDVSWFRNGSLEVHIEHENSGDDWDILLSHEIADLRNSSAVLKVLITYVRPDAYPANGYAERLAELLNRDEVKSSEWLLVVAPWYPEEAADYVAHYLRASFTREFLVIPSGFRTAE